MLFSCSWALPRVIGQIKFRVHQVPARKTGCRVGASALTGGPKPDLYPLINHEHFHQESCLRCCTIWGEANTWCAGTQNTKVLRTGSLHQAYELILVSLKSFEKLFLVWAWFPLTVLPSTSVVTYNTSPISPCSSGAILAEAVSWAELFHYVVALQCGKVFRRDHSLNERRVIESPEPMQSLIIFFF